MGLGKTLTMIALIVHQSSSSGNDDETRRLGRQQQEQQQQRGIEEEEMRKLTLIVCPTNVLDHWKTEIETNCDVNSIRLIVFHGEEREYNLDRELRATNDAIDSGVSTTTIVLTTYGIVRNEFAQKGFLFRVKQFFFLLPLSSTNTNYFFTPKTIRRYFFFFFFNGLVFSFL